ncbi:hypothetical protein BJ322DRAFT_439442 [Thelephora terrestris]|uniref:Uncharacterized protein n=1 Tax=Thelephora terrestris TaxID=56493 RepID=A0A9P6HPC1_9AGAM|nr:hypothetical protein BJ322DRAFT_439442 [Thelephora terrestris]
MTRSLIETLVIVVHGHSRSAYHTTRFVVTFALAVLCGLLRDLSLRFRFRSPLDAAHLGHNLIRHSPNQSHIHRASSHEHVVYSVYDNVYEDKYADQNLNLDVATIHVRVEPRSTQTCKADAVDCSSLSSNGTRFLTSAVFFATPALTHRYFFDPS